ncbi:MAG: NAD(P)/FAD-dependent oxidoreductase [Bacteroidota bacterium]
MKIIITGGGAAGLMAAVSAGMAGCRDVLLLESNKRCGTKILMSGGTRCNVTNQSLSAGDFYCGNKNFLKNIFSAFDNQKTVGFFSQLGLKMKTEPSGKIFPASDDAADVLNVLLTKIHSLGIQIEYSSRVTGICFKDDKFEVTASDRTYQSEKVILTTGGQSYPSTGSDGSGYALACSLGHSIIKPLPALSPVTVEDSVLTSLSGISVEARISISGKEIKTIHSEGSLLFTHFGLSGPAALNISREIARLSGQAVNFTLNFLPRYSYDSLAAELRDQIARSNPKTVLNYLRELLPLQLLESLFRYCSLDQGIRFSSLKKDELNKLCNTLTCYRLNRPGVRGFRQAEVTAGGVPLSEVRFQTMESKLREGLYLAGEILDVDGKIGGFNFQWAWSTGYIAGTSAAKKWIL